jgi:hypothetical protein
LHPPPKEVARGRAAAAPNRERSAGGAQAAPDALAGRGTVGGRAGHGQRFVPLHAPRLTRCIGQCKSNRQNIFATRETKNKTGDLNRKMDTDGRGSNSTVIRWTGKLGAERLKAESEQKPRQRSLAGGTPEVISRTMPA